MPDALPTLTYQRIRLPILTASFGQALDALTGAAPVLWRGNDAAFEILLTRGEFLLDISPYAAISLDVKTNTLAGLLGGSLMTKTVVAADCNNTVTADQWKAETAQHCSFIFTGEECNVAMGSLEDTFWLVISAVTNDATPRQITLGYALLKIKQDGVGSADPAVATDPPYYSKGESDALFARTSVANGAWRFQGQFLQLYNNDQHKFHSVWIAGAPGAETLVIGPGEA